MFARDLKKTVCTSAALGIRNSLASRVTRGKGFCRLRTQYDLAEWGQGSSWASLADLEYLELGRVQSCSSLG